MDESMTVRPGGPRGPGLGAPIVGELVTLESLATGPIVIDYQISGVSLVRTAVTGPARNVAAVAILSGRKIVWTETLTQALPDYTVGYDVDGGDVCYRHPTSFELTIPTEMQLGSVLMRTVLTRSGQAPQRFAGYVSSWPLTSDLGEIRPLFA